MAATLLVCGPVTVLAGRAAQAETPPVPQGLSTSRVDVADYPSVGLIVTLPQGLPQPSLVTDLRVVVAGAVVEPAVGRLSAQDLQVMVVPDRALSPPLLVAQRAALARLLLALPEGAGTALLPAEHAAPTRFTADPAETVSAALQLRHGQEPSDAVRLNASLATFAAGVQVRRTVLFVAGSNRPVPRDELEHLRQRLLASGTALYVLDLTPRGDSPLDQLAASSGGAAGRAEPTDAAAAEQMAAFDDRLVSDVGRQYYLRFSVAAPLPTTVRVQLGAATSAPGAWVALPTGNPRAPGLLPSLEPPALRGSGPWGGVFLGAAALMVGLSLVYALAMLVGSRREPRRLRRRPSGPVGAGGVRRLDEVDPVDELFFVFMLPCLNEAEVILASLDRLLSIPGDRFAVMVIDDASDDATGAVVSTVVGDRVWLLRRALPEARQGKGEALNAAVAHLVGSAWLVGRDPDNVVVVVVDADGRLEPHAVAEVAPYFRDPTVGGVQIGVRINNRRTSTLARMQDMEFVIYGEVFQRGRRHLDSVGLGGNGQFMRLSALLTLGTAPWSRSLTEDLDLGVRLLARGWRNEFCATAAVHQQGVVQLGRLVRQRTRWFQGHLQSWRLLPIVLRSVPGRARADLMYHLTSPLLLLIASLLTASFALSLLAGVALALRGQDPFGWWVVTTYALSFGPSLAYSVVYWRRERANGAGLLRCCGWAHLYVLYGLMWYGAGWWALSRTLRGSNGWAKTARTREEPVALVLEDLAAQEAGAALGAGSR